MCDLSHSCTLLKLLDGMRCHLSGKHVVSSNIVLDMGPVPLREGEIWGAETQFVAMPPIAKLLWPLLRIIVVNSVCSLKVETLF